MGIPWYFYTIYKKFNTENDLSISEQQIQNSDIEYLFLDYNSMIHPCAHKCLAEMEKGMGTMNTEFIEDQIIKSCLDYTRYIMNVVKPMYLYIMIDGVAPRAKMNQQRERRYKSHFFKELTPQAPNAPQIQEWNSNKITPGTDFMSRLTRSLEKFKHDVLVDCRGFLTDVVISDSDVPGEGEHKMIKIISDLRNTRGKVCIYGLDADLIMLSLMNCDNTDLVLIRDNTFNNKLSEENRVYTYLDINRLRTYICKDVRSNFTGHLSGLSDKNLVYDYIFLCFLLGNDFLEHIPSLLIKRGGINVLVKHYSTILNTRKYTSLIHLNQLTNGNLSESINLDMLKDLFYHLAKNETGFFKMIQTKQSNTGGNSFNSIYRDTYDMDKINMCDSNVFIYKDDYIRYDQPGYKERYYRFYGITDVHGCCDNYITGLYWILGYYQGHIHNDWSWYYEHHAVPFVSDISEYLTNNLNKIYTKNIQTSLPVTPQEQLFMVLPKQSLVEILGNEKLARIFRTSSIELSQLYPDKIYLDMINKEYMWQSKVFLKPFNKEFLKCIL